MNRRRIVITGIGAITPIGSGVDELWRGVQRGISSVRRVTRFDPTPFRPQCAAEIDDFDPLDYLDRRRARRLDRFSQLAVASSLQAISDAGLDLETLAGETTGCYLGSALAGMAAGEDQHKDFLHGGIRAVSPWLALGVFGAAAPANVAITLGLRGPNVSNGNGCAAGAMAIGEAFHRMQRGGLDLVLAGGAEAPLAPLTFSSFAIIKAMSTANESPATASRPFDAARDGFVMGEGAAMLVLESLEHALARDARVYAEIRGYGTTNDAYHMCVPVPDGLEAARAIRLALDDAGLTSDEVEYVNAHASGTVLGDRAEAAAIREAFGKRASRVPVSGTKGLYGHPLGASGAIEVAISALAIARGHLPGTANLAESDPDCDLSLIPPGGLERDPHVIVKNAFGFGGANVSLVLTDPRSSP